MQWNIVWRHALLFPLFSIIACNWTTTRELLDLAFLDKIARKFQITSPSLIESGTPFNVVVLYTDTNGGKSAGRFADYLTWEVVGAGSLTQTAPGTITSGIYQTTLIYSNTALTTGQSATIVIKAIDPNNPSVNGITGSVTAKFPVSLSTFKFSAPTLAYQTTSFTVTISAIGTDSSVMSSYNGTVNLTPTVTGMTTPDGTLTPATATFTNGVATVSNVQYTKPAGSLYINATDSVDVAKTGRSNGIQMAGDGFSLSAIPVDVNAIAPMDAVRISWTKPLNGFSYRIYRETSPGTFTQLAGSPVFNPNTTFVDNDVAMVLGQTYTYKVETRNNVGDLLKEATTQVLYQNCTTTVSSSISATTNWSLTGSPYCLTAAINLTAALTIDPGVLVLVTGAASGITIGAGGSIRSNGTATQPVIFTASAYNPAVTAWVGIGGGGVANNLKVTTLSSEAVSETNFDTIPADSVGSAYFYTVFEYARQAISTNKPVWIENCLFRKNASDQLTVDSSSVGYFAAAADWIVVKNSAFVSNTHPGSNVPGGVPDLQISSGKAVIRNNTFQGSIGTNYPSVMFQTGTSNTFTGNAFYNTTSPSPGALRIENVTNAFIRNNLFSATSATGTAAGAIYSGNTSAAATIISGNTFDSCSAGTNNGGAIWGSFTITNNVFKNTVSGSSGAIIDLGQSTIVNNVFIGTHASTGNGGAITMNNNGSTVQNNSFYGTYSANHGGGMLVSTNGSTVISYNYFKDSYANGNGGAIITNGTQTGLVISHNSFNNTRKGGSAGNPNGLYNTINGAFTVANNWWGSDYSLTTICPGVATNLCETTQTGFPALTANNASAWPLCCAAPSDPNCVGATTLPTGQACN